MSGSELCMVDSDDTNELAVCMMADLMYWQSRREINGHGTKCSLIYKVLQCIRASDTNSYEPRVLSIGPYHHGATSLLPLEKEKWLCLDFVLKLNSNRSLHDYLSVITTLESDVRICYSEDNMMNSRSFVEMLLLDSCFILVSLNGIRGLKVKEDVYKGCSGHEDLLTVAVNRQNELTEKAKEIISGSMACFTCRASEDFVVQMGQQEVVTCQEISQGNLEPYYSQSQESTGHDEQWYSSSAVYDLLLLENQIPFFVVTKIYELLLDDKSTTTRLLTDNLAEFIEGVLLHFPLAIRDTDRPKEFDHLLHLCYMYFKPSRSAQHNDQTMKKKAGCFCNLFCWGMKYIGSNIDSPENEVIPHTKTVVEDAFSVRQLKRWRRAEEYHEAGVEFMEREFDEQDPHSPLDIEFRNGILRIPCLPIDDKSGILLSNLLAFEQSCPALGNAMASYVYFMSRLISVPDDVALLSRKGVIVHQLQSDEEVATLFTRLFEYVVFDFTGDHYLKSLCYTMDAYYQNRVNRWMSWLRHNHFGNPWLGFAALASIIMLFCSIGQTVIAFLSYMSIISTS